MRNIISVFKITVFYKINIYKDGIKNAFKKLYSPDFQKNLTMLENPFENKNGSKTILDGTLKFLKNKKELKKGFFDLSFDQNKK